MGPRSASTLYLEAARGWEGVAVRAAPRDYLALRTRARAAHACLSATPHPREVCVYCSRITTAPYIILQLVIVVCLTCPRRSTVSHKLLLTKLELSRCDSFLNNPFRCVKLRDYNKKKELTSFISAYKCNKYGVLQGSVLGPLLFLLYINDHLDIIDKHRTLFADDISIVFPSNRNMISVIHGEA